MQVLQADWDPTFSEASFGFRPGRSAHQAVERAQEHGRTLEDEVRFLGRARRHERNEQRGHQCHDAAPKQ